MLAFEAAIIAIGRANCQVALMAPTEIPGATALFFSPANFEKMPDIASCC